jgi:DNA-binding transcriptional LysR family regulator
VRCDDSAGYWALVRAGCGLGIAQKAIGQADRTVEELDIPFALPVLPVWLTAHEAMRQTPRARRVWELLESGLKPLVP